MMSSFPKQNKERNTDISSTLYVYEIVEEDFEDPSYFPAAALLLKIPETNMLKY